MATGITKETSKEPSKTEESNQTTTPPSGVNKDGTPDMRLKENRDDPEKVAEAAERQDPQAVPEGGHNKDGTPDMRLKENRNNPDTVAEVQSKK